jgi:Glycosyl hydrolases family 15
VAWTRAALVLVVAGAVAVVVVSGGSRADPRTPAALAGLPPPFLGTAVAGSGGLTAAIDAYGDVVDLRTPGPAGRALIDDSAARQEAGSVPADTGIVPRVSIGDGPPEPLWRADSVAQRYLPRTGVVRTVARFGQVTVVITDAAVGEKLALAVVVLAPPGMPAVPTIGVNLAAAEGGRCERERRPRRVAMVCSSGAAWSATGTGAVAAEAEGIIRTATVEDRDWIARARPLGAAAPRWARQMYRRSLLTLRALSDRRTGAVAAGAREGWAYVWPRDAGTAALAFAAAGYHAEARRIAGFLRRLNLGAAARFYGNGAAVPDREAQGDAAGWVAVATRAAGIPSPRERLPWRERPDYQEGTPGDYLANAIANAPETPAGRPRTHPYGGKSAHRPGGAGIAAAFGTSGGLVRRAGDPGSGLDSAAAWAVRPFPQPALFPAVRRTLVQLTAKQTRFGITPGAAWPGVDPWMAPTAWSAWSLAALAGRERRRSPEAGDRDRRAALRLLGDLRRAATPAGELPERVNARTGVPRSTTPLAWPHAFAILALRELWPGRLAADSSSAWTG